jgi:mRNA interferase YafQ
MREAIRTSQFKRDVKLAEKRGKDMAKLREVLQLFIDEKQLPAQYKDHQLTGNWKHHRDLHIEPDWLLIYRIDGSNLYLFPHGNSCRYFLRVRRPAGMVGFVVGR